MARQAAVLSLSLLAGCGDVVDAPNPNERPVVIEGLLVAGTSEAKFRVLRGTDPVRPERVSLSLAGPMGVVPLVVVTASSTSFGTRVPVLPGSAYRLAGTVDGVSITAETRVPDLVEVREPAADTLDLERGRIHRIRFHWRAAGATIFATADAFFALGARATSDTIGELFLDPPAVPGVGPLTVWALNPDAAGYLWSGPNPPRTNIRGGFGVFAGAARMTRTIRWH